MLDTFHMNMEEFDLAGAIRGTGSAARAFPGEREQPRLRRLRPIDWPAIARALHDVGYRGPIVLEPFRRDDERAGVTLAQWRAPTRDEDAELAASIAYLKGALAFAGRAA